MDTLTYQPFAELVKAPAMQSPEMQDLSKGLRRLSHELHMNMPDSERGVSALAGAGLVALGLSSRSTLGKLIFLGLGAALIGRGATGECLGYRALDIDRRHVG